MEEPQAHQPSPEIQSHLEEKKKVNRSLGVAILVAAFAYFATRAVVGDIDERAQAIALAGALIGLVSVIGFAARERSRLLIAQTEILVSALVGVGGALAITYLGAGGLLVIGALFLGGALILNKRINSSDEDSPASSK